ncbi:MAG: type III secretion system chaperone [Desulfovibrio sp.]|nr:type III secretion system chaperone [Desulfovibrio sp.]
MNAKDLIQQLGSALGFPLELSSQNTCGVFFDQDEIIFEQHEQQLYIIADLGSSTRRLDAHMRLLEANCLGAQSGQACLGLDAQRQVFTLHRILDGELTYEQFEHILTLFIRATRYWKEWLAQPVAHQRTRSTFVPQGIRV